MFWTFAFLFPFYVPRNVGAAAFNYNACLTNLYFYIMVTLHSAAAIRRAWGDTSWLADCVGGAKDDVGSGGDYI